MADCTLIIGNKNYSSWSLRAWLLLRQAGIDFEEMRIALSLPDTKERLLGYSPAGKVPTLIHGGRTIWDTMAIGEYVSEQLMGGKGWPADAGARVHARSICAEMHAGFAGLRDEWPMNCRWSRPLAPSDEVRRDIERIDAMWCDCAQRFGATGGWLFGEFSLADCFYAPVVLRFNSYGAKVSEDAHAYMEFLLANPHMRAWIEAGRAETEIIDDDEVDLPE